MEVIYTSKELNLKLSEIKSEKGRVGFVPTMGSLHAGHGFLLKEARKAADIVVLSIFVNPTQFNVQSDFLAYPNALESDLNLAKLLGVDVVFVPQAPDLYGGIPTANPVDYGELTKAYEASNRLGHFDGVVAVVRKLFQIIQPEMAFFGEKDLQQIAVVRELVRQEFGGLEIVACPLIRDDSGLALSSRNARLSPSNQKIALELSRSLVRLKKALLNPSANGEDLLNQEIETLESVTGIELEYLDIVNSRTFVPLPPQEYRKGHAIVAANVASVRLIDNLFMGVEG